MSVSEEPPCSITLTEYFGGVEILEPFRASYQLVAGETTVSILHAQQNVNCVFQSTGRDQFRGVPCKRIVSLEYENTL